MTGRFQSIPNTRAAQKELVLDAVGLAPERLSDRATYCADCIETPIGPMIAIASSQGLHILEFPDRKALPGEVRRLLGVTSALRLCASDRSDQAAHALDLYFSGKDPALQMHLAPQGTAFERCHWDRLRQIPAGQTRSYAAMAEALGRPGAHRAVGRANGANPIAIAIPCHRLVAKDGALTGYGGGLWRKRWLLDHEAKHFGGIDGD